MVLSLLAIACGGSDDVRAPAANAPVQRPSSFPSACVPIPNVAWSIVVTRDGPVAGQWRHSFATSRMHDVDNDGTPDALVPVPAAVRPEQACPPSVTWDVYITRGPCGYRVGSIEGTYRPSLAGPASVSHGLEDIHTRIEVMTPRDAVQTVHYAFDGAAYREVGREVTTARCDVHPADCESLSHHSCELRGHPRIESLVDHDELGRLLFEAAAAAQSACTAPAHVVERCDVQPTFASDGRVATLEVNDCPRRRACVAPLFRAVRITPWTGDPPLQSISFQIPAP